MSDSPAWSIEFLRSALEAVDRASNQGSRRFEPSDVPVDLRGRLYVYLVHRGWVDGRDTTLTGSELARPPRLSVEGRAALGAMEEGDRIALVPHPSTSTEAWVELDHCLGPLTEEAAAAHASRSELRRIGLDQGAPSIFRALREGERNGFRWSPGHASFVADPKLGERLYVEQIDQFERVRATTPRHVAECLSDGRLDIFEDDVQSALEAIVGETFHMVDHGGEECDMLTARVSIGDKPVPTAFLLKGRGTKSRELRIADCGKNGDQIVRLLQAPAELFVIQYVGQIGANVTKDLRGKVRERRHEGHDVSFCTIDGTDTARLLSAYGHLALPQR